MSKKDNQTFNLTKEQAQAETSWFCIDATGKTLGRLSSEIAKILSGKHKVSYTPNVDSGDGVIVVNAGKVKVSGTKEANKIYQYYTGHIGGRREVPYRTMLARKPDHIIRHAVEGMLPKTKLGKKMAKKLRIFAGESHDMGAQQPIGI